MARTRAMSRAAQAAVDHVATADAHRTTPTTPIKGPSHHHDEEVCRPAKRARTVKVPLSNKVEVLHEDQRLTVAMPKATAKPTARSENTIDAKKDGPQFLTVARDMKRPAGERRPPQIWDVPKKKRNTGVIKEAKGWPAPLVTKISKLKPGQMEIRVKPVVLESSEWYYEALGRASTQRMYMIERIKHFEADCHAGHEDCPTETVRIAGSSGNVYTVYISHKPTCTCPDARFRQRTCKHISYVLHHVLKAPAILCQQEAFLTDELKRIAASAPPIPQVEVVAITNGANEDNRKAIEDDCPICCMEFGDDKEEIVWCESSCGNNIHKSCFAKWSQMKEKQGHDVTCPFCRAQWQKAKTVQAGPQIISRGLSLPDFTTNGYLNVGHQLGYV